MAICCMLGLFGGGTVFERIWGVGIRVSLLE